MKHHWYALILIIIAFTPKAATISGNVVSESGGLGLANIEVCATRRIDQSLFECALTAANGTYTVGNLPNENDLIVLINNTFSQPYQFETYENQAAYDWDNATGVDISSSNATGIDFALTAGFFISGTVLEQGTDNPIIGVAVCIHRTDGSFAGACRDTEAGGVYQIPALPAGSDYVAYVLGEGLGYKRQMWDLMDCPSGNCDFSQGTPISIGPNHIENIDFSLEKVLPISELQRNALVALYNSTDGLNWTNNTNWLVDDPCVNAWYGIECSNGSITEINLEGNNLIGTIPSELGNLTNLDILDLGINYLNGSIPSTLNSISNLRLLWLKENLLSGSIPEFLGDMTSLENLWISDNQFSGRIPAELGNLTNLIWITLSRNQLTGAIPTELSNLTNLENLLIHQNQLSGTIPTELSLLTNLKWLNLRDNNLTGEIPPILASLSNLERLDLQQNNLSGSIPQELGSMNNLRIMQLYLNDLTGNIPAELGNLQSIERLHLFANRLTGTIPTELGNLTTMQRMFLFSNQLTGLVPTSLMNMKNLTQLKLDRNTLYSDDAPLIEFMNTICKCDWSESQTLAPLNSLVVASSNNTMSLNWDVVDFQQHGGYRIYMSQNVNGPFDEIYQTFGKMTTAYTKGGLEPETDYYFQIKTFTYPHIVETGIPFLELVEQPNLVISESSETISGSTSLTPNSADLYTEISSDDLFRRTNNGIELRTDIGDMVEYIMIVGNNGPDDAIGSGFRHNFPTGLINTLWTCETNTGSATCPATSGTEDLDLTLDLPVNTSLKFTFTGEVATIDEASLLITSTITPPDGVSDTNLDSNDNSTNFEVIFVNGFE